MKGSVLIITMYIMVIMSLLLLTSFSIAESHFIISKNEDLHQEAYYLAEFGMNYAIEEMKGIVRQAFEECIEGFKWDPIKYPLSSYQEAAQKYVFNQLGPKIRKLLIDNGCLMYLPSPELPNAPEDAKIDIRISFTDIYQNPSRLLISSRGEIGKIRRRIDSEIYINKISGYYNSLLFDWNLITGGEIQISNEGQLDLQGPVFTQGDFQMTDNSLFSSDAPVTVSGDISLQNRSSAIFSDDVICKGLCVSGKVPGSQAALLADLYSYGEITARGEGNSIRLNGSLFVCPKDLSDSAGVAAVDGGFVEIKKEVYINGTLNFPASQTFLFGLENVPVGSKVFKSFESIGGNNSAFYFPDFSPDYAANFFKENFTSLDTANQSDLIYEYLNSPPLEDNEMENYIRHMNCINSGDILITQLEDSNFSGCTSGLLFANNQVIKPLNSMQSKDFFDDILLKMKMKTDWDFKSQLNSTIDVSNTNILPNGKSFSLLDENKPFIYIIHEDKDIILPPGDYEGILISNGSILVQPETEVEYGGLLITAGDLAVKGNLVIKQDKELLSMLLNQQDETFRRFFKIESESELFEIRSCKEVLYNLQW